MSTDQTRMEPLAQRAVQVELIQRGAKVGMLVEFGREHVVAGI